MLGSKFEACKPPRNDLKGTSIIETTDVYDARGLFWSLRPQYMINVRPKVHWTRFVLGNGIYQMKGFYFSGFRKAQVVQILSGASFAANAVPEKN